MIVRPNSPCRPAAISWLFFSIRPQIAKKFVSAAVSMMWKYCDTKPGRHSSRVLTVQIAQISSAPRRIASSTFASVTYTASMYLSPLMITGGNHMGSETALISRSSSMPALVTTSSRFFEKLHRLNVPRR